MQPAITRNVVLCLFVPELGCQAFSIDLQHLLLTPKGSGIIDYYNALFDVVP